MSAKGTAIFASMSTDARRKIHADELLAQAMGGSDSALHQLLYEAFEKRTGQPGDARTPRDGKLSPEDVRDLAKKALKRYALAKGGIPSQFAQYAARLGTTVIPSKQSVEATKVFPSAPVTPPSPSDDKRTDEAINAFNPWMPQPIIIQAPEYPPVSAPVPVAVPAGGGFAPPASGGAPQYAVDAPGGGGAVGTQPVVGGDVGPTALPLPLILAGIGVAALLIFRKGGR